MWARGLREYPVGGSLRPVPGRYRQKTAPPQLEAGWSSVPCKPGYLDVFPDPFADILAC
jgi:hypothetical protein